MAVRSSRIEVEQKLFHVNPQPQPMPKAVPPVPVGSHRTRRHQIILWALRLPAFIPLILIARGWLSLNADGVLTGAEADVLGTGGELALFAALSITPYITVTGQQWVAPLRRWYGVMFAVIGLADSITASVTGAFAGGVVGRVAGHTFLAAGLLTILLAIPLVLTANTYAQRKLGRYWKKLHAVTYVIWGFLVLHLLLLDGYTTFGAADGDGDPIFHQRFYQAVAVSVPLIVLRLPPVRRWVTAQREARHWWAMSGVLLPLLALYGLGVTFMVNELFFTGIAAASLHPVAD